MGWRFFAAAVVGWAVLSSISLGYTYSGGSGTAGNPYQIADANDLNTIGLHSEDWGKCFILLNDIDMSGIAGTLYNIIGNSTTKFTGSFNGNRHIIRNATINMPGSSYIGLFGCVGTDGQVYDLGVESATITGYSSVGGLAGLNYGTISNCSATGTVTGSSYTVGGLAGSNVGTVRNCYATATVTGGISSHSIGGLIGYLATGTVSNCYAAGAVTGNSDIGGLVGYNYNSSGTVTACFWDVQLSGQPTSAGGTGKTTAQMQDINTYLFARWDFDFETINGTQNIWVISSGQYPRFAWQPGTPLDIVTVPGVVLMTQPAAENALIAAGLTVWVTNVYSDTVAAGTVISQNPAVGTSLLAGMPVNITVSLGPNNPGSGTVADPYRIGTVADWQRLMSGAIGWSQYSILIADLDLRYVTLTPVGNSSSKFTGFFNGNGHIIRNATINASTTDYIGLFGYIDTNGRIAYLGLESATMTSMSSVGGLAGVSYGTVSHCSAAGTVTGSSYSVGGLVGVSYGILSHCSASGIVTVTASVNSSYVGGLVGYNTGPVDHCYATGTVTSNGIYYDPLYIGGLIGYNSNVAVSQCYATGTVTSNGIYYDPFYIGGLMGYNSSVAVDQCYATGNVTSNGGINDSSYIGGLMGIGGNVSNCYATGTVSSSGNPYNVGGLIGSGGIVNKCYATGAVISSSPIGGLIGENSFLALDSFWDTETSGKPASGGGTGKTTAQMKTLSTFTDAGWDFAGETVNGTQNIWTISPGQYPRFVWQESTPPAAVTVPDVILLTQAAAENALIAAGLTVWVTNVYSNTVAAGTVMNQSLAAGTILQAGLPVNIAVSLGPNYPGLGTEANPYRIGTIADWWTLMTTSANWNKYYILIADLDLRFVILTPVGNSTTKFTGSFNGNGHLIRNAMINASSNSYIGLFGYIGTSGRVFDLGLESATMTGDSDVGGLVGGNVGTVNRCYVTGDIAGNDYVGGFVGGNGGTVSYCSMTGTVTGKVICDSSYIGGLIGYNNGPVNHCYATGTVTGFSYVGGLAGYNYTGHIDQSYSTGTITACNNFGGLVGYNSTGHINQCYSTGPINVNQPAGQYVGGLAGYNSSGSIEQCYSTGAVINGSTATTYQYVGGLAGYNESGTINNCYSTRAVGGSSYLGGLIGSNNGTINRCYSTGAVKGSGGGLSGPNPGTITGSFWNTQTSGKTVSGGGTGKTTTEMQTLLTFTLAGWDFATIWAICEGTNYPRLQWQIPAGDWVCPDGVNVEDLDYFVRRWLMNNCTSSNNYCGGTDMNTSGGVDLADWAMFAEHWLEGL
jgi:hypothetical protein